MSSAYKLELFKGYFIMLMKNNDLYVNFSFKLGHLVLARK